MAQNMQTENKAVYLDPFRYNEFEGFNSHNHIVVTEVGDGTSSCRRASTRSVWRTAG